MKHLNFLKSFSGPDITEGDGIFSGYHFEVFQAGFYAVEISATFNDSLGNEINLHSVGKSFYVVQPIANTGEDVIPPARYAY